MTLTSVLALCACGAPREPRREGASTSDSSRAFVSGGRRWDGTLALRTTSDDLTAYLCVTSAVGNEMWRPILANTALVTIGDEGQDGWILEQELGYPACLLDGPPTIWVINRLHEQPWEALLSLHSRLPSLDLSRTALLSAPMERGSLSDRTFERLALTAGERGPRLRWVAPGDHSDGAVRIEVIDIVSDPIPSLRGAVTNLVVTRTTVGPASVLVTGELGARLQRDLAERHCPETESGRCAGLAADLLILPSSCVFGLDPVFLERVGPSAVIFHDDEEAAARSRDLGNAIRQCGRAPGVEVLEQGIDVYFAHPHSRIIATHHPGAPGWQVELDP